MNKLQTAFENFDSQNPRVWALFVTYALQAVQAKVRIGGKLIMERIRWQSLVDTVGSRFKVNNSYTSYYVRKWQREFPEHADLFSTRKVKGDTKWTPC